MKSKHSNKFPSFERNRVNEMGEFILKYYTTQQQSFKSLSVLRKLSYIHKDDMVYMSKRKSFDIKKHHPPAGTNENVHNLCHASNFLWLLLWGLLHFILHLPCTSAYKIYSCPSNKLYAFTYQKM